MAFKWHFHSNKLFSSNLNSQWKSGYETGFRIPFLIISGMDGIVWIFYCCLVWYKAYENCKANTNTKDFVIGNQFHVQETDLHMIYTLTTPKCILHVPYRMYWHCFNTHDDVIKWKHFPRYWPFVRGIHRSPVNSPHKGQWRGALMFSLIFPRINGWINNREAGDLRRYRSHYDVIVMTLIQRIASLHIRWHAMSSRSKFSTRAQIKRVLCEQTMNLGPARASENHDAVYLLMIYNNSAYTKAWKNKWLTTLHSTIV